MNWEKNLKFISFIMEFISFYKFLVTAQMYLDIYNNNPTAGGIDGSLVSQIDGSNPITVGPLNCSGQESSPLMLAIRADAGYTTGVVATISAAGTNSTDWAFAPDNAGVPGVFVGYGSPLTIPAGISNANTLFWIKAKSLVTDTPVADTSVTINLVCSVVNPA